MKRRILVFLLLIAFLSKGQSQLNIEIKGGEESVECSKELGKMQFKAEFTFSSQTNLKSYFVLPFLEGSKKIYNTICMLNLNSTQTEPSPSQSQPSPSQSQPSPSQSQPSPSQSQPSPSQSSPSPSQSQPSPSQSQPSPSQSQPSPSQSQPSPSQSRPSSSQGGDVKEMINEDIEEEIERIKNNIKASIKNLFPDEKERNEIEEYIKKILNYQLIKILHIKYLKFQKLEKMVLSILNGTVAEILTLDFEEIKKN